MIFLLVSIFLVVRKDPLLRAGRQQWRWWYRRAQMEKKTSPAGRQSPSGDGHGVEGEEGRRDDGVIVDYECEAGSEKGGCLLQ